MQPLPYSSRPWKKFAPHLRTKAGEKPHRGVAADHQPLLHKLRCHRLESDSPPSIRMPSRYIAEHALRGHSPPWSWWPWPRSRGPRGWRPCSLRPCPELPAVCPPFGQKFGCIVSFLVLGVVFAASVGAKVETGQGRYRTAEMPSRGCRCCLLRPLVVKLMLAIMYCSRHGCLKDEPFRDFTRCSLHPANTTGRSSRWNQAKSSSKKQKTSCVSAWQICHLLLPAGKYVHMRYATRVSLSLVTKTVLRRRKIVRKKHPFPLLSFPKARERGDTAKRPGHARHALTAPHNDGDEKPSTTINNNSTNTFFC